MPELQDILFICTVGFTVGEYVFEAGTVYAFTKEELEEIPQEELMAIMQYAMSGDYGTLTTPEDIISEFPNGALATCDDPIETSVLVIENEMEIPPETFETFTLDDLRVIIQAETDIKLDLERLVYEKIFVLKQFELRNRIYNLYQVKAIYWSQEESERYYNNGYCQYANTIFRLKSFRALQSFYDPITALSMIEGEYIAEYIVYCDAQARAFESLLAGHLVEYYKPPIYGFNHKELILNTEAPNGSVMGDVSYLLSQPDTDNTGVGTASLFISSHNNRIPIPDTNNDVYIVIRHSSTPQYNASLKYEGNGVFFIGTVTANEVKYSILKVEGGSNREATIVFS